MSLELVFNELSSVATGTIEEAKSRMETFLLSLRACFTHGVQRTLRVEPEFHDMSLAENYSLAQWRNDHTVSKDSRDYLRALATAAPFLTGFEELLENLGTHDFRRGGRIANGLGAAVLLNGVAISLLTDSEWDAPTLQVDHSFLSPVDEIETRTEAVIHVSRPQHASGHAVHFETELRRGIQSGSQLWELRQTLLPSLQFCRSVEAQLRSLTSGDPLLVQVVRHLREMQTFCEAWNQGGFDSATYPSRVSRESNATLEKYGHERAFVCPDGVRRVFSWHIRITPSAWRLYFIPDPDRRTMTIGYIGAHLSIVSEN